MKEVIIVYCKDKNNKVKQEIIDVSLVPNYIDMGWTTEKPKMDNEKPILNKSMKKENSK